MKDINEVCEYYCGDGMSKLKQISYQIFIKIGGINESDYDDFYSIANETVYYAAKNFNENENDNFEVFLKGCLSKKFKTEMTKRNRYRRIPNSQLDRLDAPLKEGDHGSGTMGDLIDSGFKIENEISILSGGNNVTNYIKMLTPKQRKIAKLVIEGYELSDIKEMLHISDEKFNSQLNRMKTFDKRIVLKNHND